MKKYQKIIIYKRINIYINIFITKFKNFLINKIVLFKCNRIKEIDIKNKLLNII